ncbi:MAG: hypothetical protein M3063_13040 [Actinomycetota bacterium]|nr:hypothetical protein [Actinomycetota bacterium]
MLTNFPITQVDHIMRRTLYSTAAVVILGVTAAIVVGYPLVAPGLVVGFGMAVLNHRAFQGSAIRFISDDGTVARKPFAGTVLMRLGSCTAIALLLLVFVQPMGWGVIGALALFQASLLLNAIVALLRYQREELTDDA